MALGRTASCLGRDHFAADARPYRAPPRPFGHARGVRLQEPITVSGNPLVKGRDPVLVNVRVTRHGPLVSDAINANNAELETEPKPAPLEPLAFRWTALDPGDLTVPSFLKLNEARDWKQFTEALRDFVSPSQNFVYATSTAHRILLALPHPGPYSGQ